MKSLILHIGCEKTGSTSIQYFLNMNNKKLFQQGFYFTKSFGQPNNIFISYSFINPQRVEGDDLEFYYQQGLKAREEIKPYQDNYKKQFENEIKNLPEHIKTVLISSEHLHSRLIKQEEILSLKKFLDKHFSEITIICYIRDQVSLSNAIYSTTLKAGSTKESYKQFIERLFKNKNYYANYGEVLKNWENVFGYDAMNVRIFNKEELYMRDVVKDYLCIVDSSLAELPLEYPDTLNKSLSLVQQGVMRSLNNSISAWDSESKPNNVRWSILHKIEKIVGQNRMLTEEDISIIYQEFLLSNELVRAKHFCDKEGVLFKKTKVKADVYNIKNIEEEIFELLNIVFNELLIDKENQLKDKENQFEVMQNELNRLKRIERSNIWKFSYPLRKIMDLIKKIVFKKY